MVAVGDTWHGHELLSELERGMVRTFLARPIGDRSDLVWLHVREGARLDREVFASEIERLQRISDRIPQIERVQYGGVTDGVAWAASSFHKGAIRLKDATRGADLGLTAIEEVSDIGVYLQKAHDLGAVHGALSPERVLITAEGGYAFTQFGFARLFEISGEDAIREPRYAAPEMVFEGDISKRTDVYGLGTILYELLCRCELYSGSDEEGRATSAKTWEPSFPSWVPSTLRFVMKRALSKEPKDRYSSIRMMLVELAAVENECRDFFSGASGRSRSDQETDVATPAGARPRSRGQKLAVDNDPWEPFEPPERECGDEPRSSAESRHAERSSSTVALRSPEVLAPEEGPANDAATTGGPGSRPLPGRPLDIPELVPLAPSPRPQPLAARPTEGVARRGPVRLVAMALALVGSVLGATWLLRLRSERPVDVAARLPRVVYVAAPSPGAQAAGGLSEVVRQPSREAPVSAPQRPRRMRDAAFARRTAETPAPAGAQAMGDGIYIYGGDTSF